MVVSAQEVLVVLEKLKSRDASRASKRVPRQR
jgi:hypothetical protein